MSSLLKIALLLAGLMTSCGHRTISQSSRLSEAELIAVTEAFERLDQSLKRSAPNIHAGFHAGATEEDLDKLHNCLSGNQVEVLDRWFKWHNGSVQNILPGGAPISVARSVEDQRILQSIPFAPSFRLNAVKILDDSSGDGFFVDVNSETPLVFHHVLQDPENPVWFGTVAEFIHFIAAGFETGILFENSEGRFAYDDAKYEEWMSEYLNRATKWN